VEARPVHAAPCGDDLDWSPGAVLSETEGVARGGRRRGARGHALVEPDSEENAERCARVRAEVGACRENALPIGRFRETRVSPLAPARARVPVFENVDCTASVRRILVDLTCSSGRVRTTQPEISTEAALTRGRGQKRVKRVRESFSG